MANQEHLAILNEGVEIWNEWRTEHADIKPDLKEANLSDAYLREANFSETNLNIANLNRADLRGANFSNAELIEAALNRADLSFAHLSEANLSFVHLSEADLRGVSLGEADLWRADLNEANLSEADLRGADLSNARVGRTLFGNVDLSVVKGLETVVHQGLSTIGIDTIIKSQGKIPEAFLRGAGVPPSIIEAIPALVGSLKPIEFYSCFLSYSSRDQAFAERLHADLQAKGVRVWFAPHDLKPGDLLRHRIDEAIRVYDKLLLILSEHSVTSTWVEFEVEAALDKEKQRGENATVLFPIRLDAMVMTSSTPWAAHLRRTRHIGNFEQWKSHDEYQEAFARLLHDLKASTQQ